MPTETTFLNKTETWFTLIEIKKEVLRKTYLAYFEHGKNPNKLSGCALRGNDLDDLINKLKEFLDCEITEKHYIIK